MRNTLISLMSRLGLKQQPPPGSSLYTTHHARHYHNTPAITAIITNHQRELSDILSQ